MFEFAKRCIANGKIYTTRQIDHMLNKNWISEDEHGELLTYLKDPHLIDISKLDEEKNSVSI